MRRAEPGKRIYGATVKFDGSEIALEEPIMDRQHFDGVRRRKLSMQFAPPIIAARKRAGLSQRDLALEVGVSARAVWLIENGGGTIKVLSPILDRLRIGVTGLPPARSLGARLEAARSKRGWSRQELAKRSRLSLPTLR